MAVVGIDLGTTMSVVARLDEFGKPVVLKNDEGEILTPSVVYFESRTNKVVGTQARKEACTYPELVIETVKNQMGKETTWEMHGEEYTPEQVSAIVLRRLKEGAEAEIGEPVDAAVITVPAIFGDSERHATRAAAAIAGLEVIAILEEPVAAAIAYGFGGDRRLKSGSTVLLFDLGGGTFDLTVMRIEGDAFRMMATDGDRKLGGKDWDRELVDHVARRFVAEHGTDPRKDPETWQSMMAEAEAVKKALTKKDRQAFTCAHEGKKTRVEIGRDEFEAIVKHLLDQTLETTSSVIARLVDSGKLPGGWRDVDKVLLVGGSSRMPMVSRALRELSGKEPEILDVDLVVAQGAAMYSVMKTAQSAQETGDRTRLESLGLPAGFEEVMAKAEVTRVCSFALGVRAYSDDVLLNNVLVPFNAELPAVHTETFATRYDNQSEVAFAILEGEDPDPAFCKTLGEGQMTIPPGLPAGSPIEVTIGLDDESAIFVMAVETTHGTTCEFEVRREVSLTPQQVQESKRRLSLDSVS